MNQSVARIVYDKWENARVVRAVVEERDRRSGTGVRLEMATRVARPRGDGLEPLGHCRTRTRCLARHGRGCPSRPLIMVARQALGRARARVDTESCESGVARRRCSVEFSDRGPLARPSIIGCPEEDSVTLCATPARLAGRTFRVLCAARAGSLIPVPKRKRAAQCATLYHLVPRRGLEPPHRCRR